MIIIKFLSFLANLFARLFQNPNRDLHSHRIVMPAASSGNGTVVDMGLGDDGLALETEVILPPSGRTALNEAQKANCIVLGKHRVKLLDETGHFKTVKVFGQLKPGKINRVRAFGHSGIGHEPVARRLIPA